MGNIHTSQARLGRESLGSNIGWIGSITLLRINTVNTLVSLGRGCASVTILALSAVSAIDTIDAMGA